MILAVLRFGVAVVFTWYWSSALILLAPFVGARRAWLIVRIRWAHWTMWALGIDWQIENPERIGKASIFVCNHQSFLDVVLLPAMLPPETVFVAKREIRKVPFFGPAFAAGGGVLIDRANPRGAIESIREGIAALPSGWSIVIFPEGTRSTTGELRNFKKGCVHVALATKFPIVPMAVHGVRELTRSPRWLPRRGTVQMAIGEPIATDRWTSAATDTYLQEVREAVAVELSRARAAWARTTGETTAPVAALDQRLA